MADKLEKLLEENRAAKNMKKKHGHLTDFLAVKNDIEHVISKGWYVKEIWETLIKKGAIDMSYQTFNEYVRKHLHKKGNSQHDAQNSVSTITDKKSEHRAAEKAEVFKSNSIKSGFKYNPIPNDEELF